MIREKQIQWTGVVFFDYYLLYYVKIETPLNSNFVNSEKNLPILDLCVICKTQASKFFFFGFLI